MNFLAELNEIKGMSFNICHDEASEIVGFRQPENELDRFANAKEREMRDGEPWSESVQHVDFGGFYLTHAIWHNSYGSNQPETGVRSHAAGLKDFRLIQHNSRNWPLVTVVALAALSKGWDAERIGRVIEWMDHRYRRRVSH